MFCAAMSSALRPRDGIQLMARGTWEALFINNRREFHKYNIKYELYALVMEYYHGFAPHL